MANRCINPNNERIIELAEKLNKPRTEIAIDVEMWQDLNGMKVPTAEELYNFLVFGNDPEKAKDPNTALQLKGNEEIYKKYNLLASDGKIKTVPDTEVIKKWLDRLNESPYYTFKLRKTTEGKKIFVFPKEKIITSWIQLDSEVKVKLTDLGVNEYLFNNLNESEKANLIKCYGR